MTEYRLEPSPFAVRVDGNTLSTWRCREANIALHSAEGPLDIEVDVPFDWERVTVRPLRHGIASERTATGIRFALPAPAKLSIEFDEDLASFAERVQGSVEGTEVQGGLRTPCSGCAAPAVLGGFRDKDGTHVLNP